MQHRILRPVEHIRPGACQRGQAGAVHHVQAVGGALSPLYHIGTLNLHQLHVELIDAGHHAVAHLRVVLFRIVLINHISCVGDGMDVVECRHGVDGQMREGGLGDASVHAQGEMIVNA